jgi:radical SAM/Cys-rich protein
MSTATSPPLNTFDQTLAANGVSLTRSTPRILQLNLGKLCNIACVHCHVNAGPHRKELITSENLNRTIDWFEQTDIPTLDLTGGTPEMHPDFRSLVERVRNFDQPREVMTRLNATIIEEPGYEWVPEFHAKHHITCIASMPCYSPDNVNEQRGDGVFDRSITAFQKLNKLGYGIEPHLKLNLVYNPNGAFLPPDQKELEADYKREMKKHFDIEFHDLYCITNMAIARYASYLKRNKQLAEYNQLLIENFNPASISGLMCRDTISVDWEGRVFDCDFNQQLGMQLANGKPLDIWDLNLTAFEQMPIMTAPHCFGCTAGAGSSCGGALT